MILFTEHQTVIHASMSKGKYFFLNVLKYTKIIPTYIYNALHVLFALHYMNLLAKWLLKKIKI